MENWIAALILGIVEGLTEFLPVSSTGHMIIVGHAMNYTGPVFDSFEVFIQLGAILSVLVIYRSRFIDLFKFQSSTGFQGVRGIVLLGLTTLPALLFGFLAHSYIKQYLFSPQTVAIGLGLGGLAILLVEFRLPVPNLRHIGELKWQHALGIGFFQCLALWPGMSRSASTIVGGMLMRIERKTIAEYSFLAAVPVMFAATAYDLAKSWKDLHSSDLPFFALGFLVAFVSAWAAIRIFIGFLSSHTLKGFGIYRIILAVIVLWYFR